MGGEGGGGVITLDDPCGGLADPDVLVDVACQWSVPALNASKPTITIEGDRILAGGILWDSESRTQILPANTGRQLAGDRVLGEGGLHDAVTGSLIIGFAAQEPMGMTENGDLALYRDAAGLHVVDASGASVLDWPGAHAASHVDIQSDELQIANGDAGPGVVPLAPVSSTKSARLEAKLESSTALLSSTWVTVGVAEALPLTLMWIDTLKPLSRTSCMRTPLHS